MRRLLLVTLVAAAGCCMASVRSNAQSVTWDRAVSTGLTQERVLGLLDLPEIVVSGCGPDQAVRGSLYESGSTRAAAIGSIELVVADRQPGGGSCGAAQLVVKSPAADRAEQLPTDESGYEIPAAIVYQRSGSWFRIALQHGSAWIERPNPDGFHQYPDLLSHSLAYIRQRSDGRLRRGPVGSEAES